MFFVTIDSIAVMRALKVILLGAEQISIYCKNFIYSLINAAMLHTPTHLFSYYC